MAQEEETEEPEWLERIKKGGSLDLVDVEDISMGWSSPPSEIFLVRGVDYFDSHEKVPAGQCLLQPLGCDWMKNAQGRIDKVLLHPNNRVMKDINEMGKREGSDPFVWCINLQVPSKEHLSLVTYFVSTSPFPEGSLVDRFVKGDDEFRNSRLKLISNVVRGPWIVQVAVGDHAVCLLGKALSCQYVKGDNFIEVDVDIGSSMVANAIIHLAINYMAGLTVDLAFLLEGRSPDELPEQLLGTVRFSSLEVSAAHPLLPLQSLPLPSEEEEEEFVDALADDPNGSFSSRIWKSIEQGLASDWWQKET